MYTKYGIPSAKTKCLHEKACPLLASIPKISPLNHKYLHPQKLQARFGVLTKIISFNIEWTFFTNLQIICQNEARQRFLPYQAPIGSRPENYRHSHIIDYEVGPKTSTFHAEFADMSYVALRLIASENTFLIG